MPPHLEAMYLNEKIRENIKVGKGSKKIPAVNSAERYTDRHHGHISSLAAREACALSLRD